MLCLASGLSLEVAVDSSVESCVARCLAEWRLPVRLAAGGRGLLESGTLRQNGVQDGAGGRANGGMAGWGRKSFFPSFSRLFTQVARGCQVEEEWRGGGGAWCDFECSGCNTATYCQQSSPCYGKNSALANFDGNTHPQTHLRLQRPLGQSPVPKIDRL